VYNNSMTKEKIILTDCDGVLLNWEYAFGEWMEFHGHTPVPEHNKFYKIRDKYGLQFDEQGDQIIKNFNESAAIGFLPALRDAQYYVKLLHEKYQYKFLVVTSLSLHPYAQKLRINNLKKLFGDDAFEDFIFLDTGADKNEVLEDLANKYNNNFWIEDKPENVDIGHNLGFRGILIEHGHNMDYKGPASVVATWEEVYNIVTS